MIIIILKDDNHYDMENIRTIWYKLPIPLKENLQKYNIEDTISKCR